MQSSTKRQLVSIPQFIEFEFHPQQQLHTFINIENLTDQIISYRIKTTAPGQYLVKPMQGQIYIRQKAKIVFKRKKLSLENFEAFQNGTKPLKEKFMFVITCKSKNAIGIEKVQEQNKIANVKFVQAKRQTVESSPIKKVKKPKTIQQKNKQSELVVLIGQEKLKLEELRKQRSAEQGRLSNLATQSRLSSTSEGKMQNLFTSKSSNISTTLTRENIICLIVLFFLLGMWI